MDGIDSTKGNLILNYSFRAFIIYYIILHKNLKIYEIFTDMLLSNVFIKRHFCKPKIIITNCAQSFKS